jgi:hypothetical protein
MIYDKYRGKNTSPQSVTRSTLESVPGPSETTEKIDCSSNVQGQRLCTEYGYTEWVRQISWQAALSLELTSKHLTVWFNGGKSVTILKDILGFIMCHATVLLWCALQDSVLQIPCRT